jgi:peptidoglycan/xylan/chitin deacetylase (PgdA/CDA1 family)
MKQLVKQVVRGTGLRRSHLATARLCCERHLLATFNSNRAGPRKVGRILCYHSIGQPAWGVNDVPVATFRKQIEFALNAGFEFVPASEIVLHGGKPKSLSITFDDGMKSVLEQGAPILAEYNIPWSIFIVSDWSDGEGSWPEGTFLNWKDVDRLAAAGAEIGSHSVTHPDFSTIEQSRIEDELGRSRDTIRSRIGIDPRSFAIPFGQSQNWPAIAAQAARRVGYDVVYAQAENTRPSHTVARTFITGFDGNRVFKAALDGAYDSWEEWF